MTRVLARVTVTRASEDCSKSLVEPLVVSDPPFVVESTTDVPFLARVMLDWNGQQNVQTVVEHWVQVSHGSYLPEKCTVADSFVRSTA